MQQTDELEHLSLLSEALHATSLHPLPVLLLDEFEKLTAKPERFTDDFFNALRAFANQHKMAIITTSQHTLRELTETLGLNDLALVEEIEKDLSSYFRDKQERIKNWLNTKGLKAFKNLVWTSEQIGKIIKNLSPFSMLNLKRYLLSSLKPLFVDCTDARISSSLSRFCKSISKDIATAIERMFQSWHTYFEHTWNKENNELEREVLVGITKEKPNRRDIDKALRSLVRKEILRQEGGDYVFCVPVFKEWIVRNS